MTAVPSIKAYRASDQLPVAPIPIQTGHYLTDIDPAERQRLMAEFSIGYDGRRYRFNGYRYDRLPGAVAYARLIRSKPAVADRGDATTWVEEDTSPRDADLGLMAALSITFTDGTYRFSDYRYDHLVDAVNYAQLTRRRAGIAGRTASA